MVNNELKNEPKDYKVMLPKYINCDILVQIEISSHYIFIWKEINNVKLLKNYIYLKTYTDKASLNINMTIADYDKTRSS